MHRWRSSHCSDSTDCMSDESEVDLDTVRQSVKLRRRVVVFSRTSRASYDSGETSEEVDLPDGCCHRKPTHLWNAPGPPKQSETSAQHDSKTGYLCEYVGSFSVTDNESWCRPELMDAQLARMRCEPSKRSVLFLVTASGVKICCADDKVVLMAHAVRRICWCTCSPGQHQFAFLAREPKLRAGLQHCHVFRARSPKQAEDLNSLVGSAFRMAYARQLQQQQQQQHQQQQRPQPHLQQPFQQGVLLRPLRSGSPSPAKTDSRSTPSSVGMAGGSRPEASPPDAYTKVWAKKVAGRTKHRDPVAEGFVELNVRALQQQSPRSPRASVHLGVERSTPAHREDDLWSPSSNEDNTASPTELNRRFADKPPPVKKLEDSWQQRGSDGTGASNTASEKTSALSESAVSSTSSNSPSSNQDEASGYAGAGGDATECRYSTPAGRRSTPSSPAPKARGGGRTVVVMPPAPPERHDSLNLNEEEELREAPWFQAGIPREIALEVLGQEPVGSFMVRKSTSKPGCFALSLRVPRSLQPTGISHYLIMHTNRGYKIKGFTKEFGTLTSLITHHSVMPELLPCPLSLSRYNSAFRRHGSAEDLVDIDDDPDYTLLADFRKMMADAI